MSGWPQHIRPYLSSLMLHMMSSFQLTKIMATSFSVSSSHSNRGLWKIYTHTHQTVVYLMCYVQIKVSSCRRLCSHLCDELEIVDVVLLCDDQLVDVPLSLPLHRTQHVQQVKVSAPCSANTHTKYACQSKFLNPTSKEWTQKKTPFNNALH